MNYFLIDLWAVLPYVVIALFVGVPIYRYMTNRFSFTSHSTELLEKRIQGTSSYLWHYGLIIVILGHIVGLLVPDSVYSALGISFRLHYLIAVSLGGTTGIIMVIGLFGLTYRRFWNKKVRATLRWDYYVIYILFYATIFSGLYNTLYYQIFVRAYNYDATVGAWLQGVLTLRPDPTLIALAPLSYQIHVALTMIFWAVFPFTFLVHMWTGLFNMVNYLFRPRIIYRKRREDVIIRQK